MQFTKAMFLVAGLVVVAMVSAPVQAQKVPEKASGEPVQSLFERLGGVYSIAAVVDDFIERIYVNETLNANPAIAGARSNLRKPGLKVQVTTMVCQVTGGPCAYGGKGMKEAHAGFRITETEWDAMAADFKAALDKFKVPTVEQDELFAIVGTTKADIVVVAESRR